jgi:hypothetical protein
MSQKKYSINWEDDEPVSFEVDGILYNELDEIPDAADREKLAAMMDNAFEQKAREEFKDFDKEAFKREFAASQKEAAAVQKLILRIFLGVAIVLLLVAGILSASTVSKMNKEKSATGLVVDMVVQRGYLNEQDRANNVVRDYYSPVVEFTSADGRRHSVQMAERSSPPSYEVGEEVTVRYDPQHPLDAHIETSGVDTWLAPGITGGLGLIFLGVVWALRKFMPVEEANGLA